MSWNDYPSVELFDQVCRNGLSTVRPLLASAAANDQWGWNYGSARPPSYWAYGRMRALLALSETRALQPKRVLEIAAGDASLCACLQEMGCEVVANDLRRENLENSVAHFRNREQIRLFPGNVFDLNPNQIGKFDLVVACEILEHVAYPVNLLRQLKRFLSPGGHILVTTPNGAYFRNRLPTYSQVEDFQALEGSQFQPDANGHLFLVTPSEMRQIAVEAGLTVKRLLVWGTPFISGESGFRFFGWAASPGSWYRLELLCRRLGAPVVHRLANSLSAVLCVET